MPAYNPVIKPGLLEVYCGPMRSGKSMELIHRVEKLHYMENCTYQFFKPAIDTRDAKIRTRFNGLKADCITISDPEEIMNHLPENCKIIAIDEVQFMPQKITSTLTYLLCKDMNVIVAGLDLDFRGEPFGPMSALLSMADEVHKLTAVCQHKGCNAPATRTQRLICGEPASYDSPIVLVENNLAQETYEARCLKHHIVPGKPSK